MLLRELKKDDINHVVDIVENTMTESLAKDCRETLKSHLDEPKNRDMFVLTDGDKVIGVCGILKTHGPTKEDAWMSWFAIDPSEHGKGFGKAMLDHVLKTAKKYKFKNLWVETYSGKQFKKAIRLYKKNGFKKVGYIKDYMEGQNMLVLKRKLT